MSIYLKHYIFTKFIAVCVMILPLLSHADPHNLLNDIKNESNRPITEADIRFAQQEWANAIVKIGLAYKEGAKEGAKDYKQVAENVIDDLYSYDEGPVLFKPTYPGAHPFRFTKDGALSYFVGGRFPDDKGFALKPWVNVKFYNSCTILNDNTALVMGLYEFTGYDVKQHSCKQAEEQCNMPTSGCDEAQCRKCSTLKAECNKAKVLYTFGYHRNKKGKLVIHLQHSSEPQAYNPEISDPLQYLVNCKIVMSK